jgi:hypothetical protein
VAFNNNNKKTFLFYLEVKIAYNIPGVQDSKLVVNNVNVEISAHNIYYRRVDNGGNY